MKYSNSFGFLSMMSLLACGQEQKKISQEDKNTINSFGQKSLLYQEKKPDSAVYFADKGLKLARRLHYLPGEGLMLDRLSRINERYDNFKLAIKYQKQPWLFLLRRTTTWLWQTLLPAWEYWRLREGILPKPNDWSA